MLPVTTAATCQQVQGLWGAESECALFYALAHICLPFNLSVDPIARDDSISMSSLLSASR
jgi:hypothetical protein